MSIIFMYCNAQVTFQTKMFISLEGAVSQPNNSNRPHVTRLFQSTAGHKPHLNCDIKYTVDGKMLAYSFEIGR